MPTEVKRCFTNHVGLFFAAGEALDGDVAGQHGEVKFKSERSVTALKTLNFSPAGVSVLNPEGGTSSSGSVWAQVRSF